MTDNQSISLVSILLGVIVLAIIGGCMWAFPKYRIYSQDKRGQANLRQQEWEKKILIEQARAEKESAVLKAEAEIERAKGVSEANKIISGSLKGNDEYLQYLWIDQLSSGQAGQIIYVPTEAGLPVLEAGRIK